MPRPFGQMTVMENLELGSFTLESVPGRVARLGDTWSAAMREPISLGSLLRRRDL